MAWITTKDGRHVNTEWFDDEERRKYAQIEFNQDAANYLNSRYNIPYKDWKHQEDRKDDHYDASTPYSIYEHDEKHYVREKDIRKVGKKDTIEEVEAWKNDDGTYGTGNGDESIYVIYDDGSYEELTDGETHRGWKSKNIKGISISTGDYMQVWGEEYNSKTKEWTPLETYEFDDNANPIQGYSNSYSGGKFTGEYNARIRRTTTFNKERNRWDTKYETTAMSTVQRYGATDNAEANRSSGKVADRLAKKGISTQWDIEQYIRGLSSTRRGSLAKELGITDLRGDMKIREMVRRIFAQGKD